MSHLTLRMNHKKSKVNILLIGCGPHAKRIYVPLLSKFKSRVNIKCIVDIKEKEEDITSFLKSMGCKTYFIKKTHMTYEKLHPIVEKKLNEFVKRDNINGVIIATEPLTHVMYSKWASS